MTTKAPETMTDEEALATAAKFSDEVVLHDLADTERELERCKKVVEGWYLIAQNHLNLDQRHMAELRHRAAQADVARGERLLAHLRRVVALRGLSA